MANISKITIPDTNEVYDIVAKHTKGMYYAETDSTSTNIAFVVTIPGITELYHGLTIMVNNTVATSATGCTINLNNLGAKRIRHSLANSYVTNHWAINTVYIFVYDANSSWWTMIEGYSNTDTEVRQRLVSADSNRPLLMAYSNNEVTTTNVDNITYRNNNIFANPSTGEITANGFNGDLNGDASTVNGHTVEKDVPSNAVFTDTNTKTRQYLSKTNVNRPLLLAYADNTDTSQYTTDYTVKSNDIYANPSTGIITANGFNGPLTVGDVGDPLYPVYFEDGVPEASSIRLRAFSNTATYLGKAYKTAFYITANFANYMAGYETMVFVVHTNYLNIEIPTYIPCAAVTGDSSNKQIFRGGWYQSGSNGGEASIMIYRDLTNSRFVAQLDYCAVNGTERTGATVDVYCK